MRTLSITTRCAALCNAAPYCGVLCCAVLRKVKDEGLAVSSVRRAVLLYAVLCCAAQFGSVLWQVRAAWPPSSHLNPFVTHPNQCYAQGGAHLNPGWEAKGQVTSPALAPAQHPHSPPPTPFAQQKSVIPALGDANMRNLQKGDVIQVRLHKSFSKVIHRPFNNFPALLRATQSGRTCSHSLHPSSAIQSTKAVDSCGLPLVMRAPPPHPPTQTHTRTHAARALARAHTRTHTLQPFYSSLAAGAQGLLHRGPAAAAPWQAHRAL